MFDALFKLLPSFRSQLVAFIALMLLITTLVIFLINRSQERRTTQVVEEYIQSIPQAIEITYQSLLQGAYLYNLVNQDEPGALRIDSESVIRHIFIVEENGNVLDSTDQKDVNQRFDSIYENLPAFQMGDLRRGDHSAKAGESRTLTFATETNKGVRKIFIVISMTRLNRVKEAGDRVRLGVFAGLGMLLIVAIAIFSKRLTRPITELSLAARHVAAGKLDFAVPVSGPGEIRVLSNTFNEMLVGLRQRADLEEQLERAERSVMVGRLASGIAHEIRNPLNFINLSIDHLRVAFAPKENASRTSYSHILTTIKDELARLNRLVSDFLSYGRPAKLKLKELNARTLIEEVRDLVQAKADEQGVRIIIESPNGASGPVQTRINADPEQIKTCFSNLMINAVQAMTGGGELHVSLHPGDAYLEIRFADTGSGILPENLSQIFEPYFSTKETGIGLGLPLTKKIIEEHGGQIGVSSAVGSGTTFTVRLQREPVITPEHVF
jgi:signal transduction histidine kinase